VRAGDLRLISSPAHLVEITAIKNLEERESLRRMLEEVGTRPAYDLIAARQRAEEFVRVKIGLADAAHLAFAEQAKADFVSVDDRFLKRASRIRLSIWLGTPLQLCERENLR
jgi:predicted nucleic acid-binding protein